MHHRKATHNAIKAVYITYLRGAGVHFLVFYDYFVVRLRNNWAAPIHNGFLVYLLHLHNWIINGRNIGYAHIFGLLSVID